MLTGGLDQYECLQEEIFEVGSEGMLVQDLAEKLACNSGDVLKTLFFKGIMAQVNQVHLAQLSWVYFFRLLKPRPSLL